MSKSRTCLPCCPFDKSWSICRLINIIKIEFFLSQKFTTNSYKSISMVLLEKKNNYQNCFTIWTNYGFGFLAWIWRIVSKALSVWRKTMITMGNAWSLMKKNGRNAIVKISPRCGVNGRSPLEVGDPEQNAKIVRTHDNTMKTLKTTSEYVKFFVNRCEILTYKFLHLTKINRLLISVWRKLYI